MKQVEQKVLGYSSWEVIAYIDCRYFTGKIQKWLRTALWMLNFFFKKLVLKYELTQV